MWNFHGYWFRSWYNLPSRCSMHIKKESTSCASSQAHNLLTTWHKRWAFTLYTQCSYVEIMPDCNWRRIMDLPSTTSSSAQPFSQQFIQLSTIHVSVLSLIMHIDFIQFESQGTVHRALDWITCIWGADDADTHWQPMLKYGLCWFHSRFHCDADTNAAQ